MRATLESTSQIVHVNGVPARVWEGASEGGVPFTALVTRVAVRADCDSAEFERDLQSCAAPRPENPFSGPIDLRLVL